MTADFYRALPAIQALEDAFDDARYGDAPADWLVAASDVQGSTQAVASGRHRDVNFAAATSIAALSNLCRPDPIPASFGGDGAVALVPPDQADGARQQLARARGFAARTLGLQLRVGLAPVAALAAAGGAVRVGRYQPSEGAAYATFLGGGVELLERSIKGRGDVALAALADVPAALDDGEPPMVDGLSCRWAPIPARRGRMVSLVVRGGDHGELYQAIARLSGTSFLKAARLDALHVHWPPRGLRFEARAKRSRLPLPATTALLLAETLLAYVLFKTRLRCGAFDPERYKREIVTNLLDFARTDDSFCLVFDCPADRIDAVSDYLDARRRAGDLAYGLHVADFALMTCFVTDLVGGRHVHFCDGGDGGYTRAAAQLKAAIAADAGVRPAAE